MEYVMQYPKDLHNLHSVFPILPKRMKIQNWNKLVCTLYDKKQYVVQIRALEQALKYGLIFQKLHRIIQFNQEAWLKPYIKMNTKLKKEAKNDFEKDFLKLMNKSVFGKTMEIVRKLRDIK